MPTLDEKLQVYYNKVSNLEHLQNHADYIQRSLSDKRKKLTVLKANLNKEERDVIELEKLSWQSLFHRVLGNKEQQLEKERQEYLMAFLQYERCEDEVAALDYEYQILESKLSQSFNAEEELKVLRKQKLKELDQLKSSTRLKVVELTENIKNHNLRVNELKHAKFQCAKVFKASDEVIEVLEKISWGIENEDKYDSRRMQKDVKSIRKLYSYASNGMERLHKELRDVSNRYDLHYDFILKTFNDFDSFFFDGLISDWIVQNKIDHSLNIMTTAKDRLLRLDLMLDQDIEKTYAYIEEEKMAQIKVLVEDTKDD